MTKEEAIKNLEMIRVAFVEPVTKEQRKLIDDTFDMAIKALEQEPCDDCVSREAVDEIIHHYKNNIDCQLSYLTDSLWELPPVNPQPKTGHWILDETDNSITCDKCGCLMWASDLCYGDAHYCPNCGARMESEVRNE